MLKNSVMSFLRARRGQGMTEYAVIVALVVLIAIAVFAATGEGTLGAAIKGVIAKVVDAIAKVTI